MAFCLMDSGLLAYGPAGDEHDGATLPDEGGPPVEAAGGASEEWLAATLSADPWEPEYVPLAVDDQPMAAQQLVGATAYPWSTVVKVTADFPNGQTFTGSGVMVGRNDVLTAAHLVYHPDRGGLATNVIVTPAYIPERGYESPYGSSYATVGPVQALATGTDVRGNNIRPGDGLRNSLAGTERDVAFLTLKVPLGDKTHWMGLDPSFKEGYANLSGYPVKHGLRLTNDVAYATDDAVDSFTSLRHFESIPGNSGGPLWRWSADGKPVVVGLASSGSGPGGAAFDIATSYTSIISWITSNDHLLIA